MSLGSRRSCSGRQAGGAGVGLLAAQPQRVAGCEPGCRSSSQETLHGCFHLEVPGFSASSPKIPAASLSFGAQRCRAPPAPPPRCQGTLPECRPASFLSSQNESDPRLFLTDAASESGRDADFQNKTDSASFLPPTAERKTICRRRRRI